MRTYFRLICLSFFAACSLHASNLVWDHTELHLEMKPDQEEIYASYTVTNNGDEVVRISEIKTSCGCTGSVIDRRIIEPGESTEIIATFNKGKRQGLQANRLQVYIDNQNGPVATLVMNVKIPKLVEVTPRIIYWRPTGQTGERRVQLNLDERYVHKIDSIEYDRTKLNVIVEEDPTGESTRILRVSPISLDETYRGSITVYTSGRDGRKADARIHAFVQP